MNNKTTNGATVNEKCMDDKMTIEMCKKHCFEENNFNYAAVQFGHECRCSNHRPEEILIREAEECNKGCYGNDQQTCGGSFRNNIYKRVGVLQTIQEDSLDILDCPWREWEIQK